MNAVLGQEYPRTRRLFLPDGEMTGEGIGNKAVVSRQGKKAMVSASKAKAERVLEARECLAVLEVTLGP